MEKEKLQTVNVFVYGTLKKGESREPALRQFAVKWVRAAILGFNIYDLGAFPAIDHSENGDQVFGELVECHNPDRVLEVLDNIEGYYGPGHERNLYNREVVTAIQLSDGVRVPAFTYVFARGFEEYHMPIASGKWTRRPGM